MLSIIKSISVLNALIKSVSMYFLYPASKGFVKNKLGFNPLLNTLLEIKYPVLS